VLAAIIGTAKSVEADKHGHGTGIQGETGGNKPAQYSGTFCGPKPPNAAVCGLAMIRANLGQAAFSARQITLIRSRIVLSSGADPLAELAMNHSCISTINAVWVAGSPRSWMRFITAT
jgi:hypothetical protein